MDRGNTAQPLASGADHQGTHAFPLPCFEGIQRVHRVQAPQVFGGQDAHFVVADAYAHRRSGCASHHDAVISGALEFTPKARTHAGPGEPGVWIGQWAEGTDGGTPRVGRA